MSRRHVFLAAMATIAVLATACTAGGTSTTPTSINSNPSASHAPVTVTVWSFFTGRELKTFDGVLDGVHQKYPWVTIQSVGGKQPTDIQRAINSNTAPDVALEPSPDDSAKYCSSGAFQNLAPFIQGDGTDLTKTTPPSALAYTGYKGVQCSLPMLSDAYGLYYNIDLMNKAGISDPPKTFSEMAADATKLTEYNADGSIKVLGWLPLPGDYEVPALDNGIYAGAQWYDSSGKSALATDPKWAALFQWQKSVVDSIGYDKITKWFASVGGANAEFSPTQAFETGKLAMNIDGEWRVAFIQSDGSKVNYGTAPFPVADDITQNYGLGQIGGTIVGIPKGAAHAAEAWLTVKHLALDTGAESTLANALKNVPTTFDALKDPTLSADPHFKTFLDIFANANSGSKQITPIGTADTDLLATFLQKYMAGNVSDLQGGLAGVAKQIDDQTQLG